MVRGWRDWANRRKESQNEIIPDYGDPKYKDGVLVKHRNTNRDGWVTMVAETRGDVAPIPGTPGPQKLKEAGRPIPPGQLGFGLLAHGRGRIPEATICGPVAATLATAPLNGPWCPLSILPHPVSSRLQAGVPSTSSLLTCFSFSWLLSLLCPVTKPISHPAGDTLSVLKALTPNP